MKGLPDQIQRIVAHRVLDKSAFNGVSGETTRCNARRHLPERFLDKRKWCDRARERPGHNFAGGVMLILSVVIAAFFAFTTGYFIGWIDGFKRGIKPSKEQP